MVDAMSSSDPSGADAIPDEGESIVGARAGQPPVAVAPGLYVVSTPIGNLRDITLRALDILGGAEEVLAEDTRVASKLLSAYGIKARLSPYHDHNGAERRPGLLKRLEEGARIALISDAGTPLVSDPGWKLVHEALEHGIKVYPVPGASALLAGLVASGLPSDRFLFAGFLPPKSGARRTEIESLKQVPATLVFYESGPRLAESLADLAFVLGDREAAVARELTKLFEETRRGTLAELAVHYDEAGPPRGEIVLLVGPAAELAPDALGLEERLEAAMAHMNMRDAVDAVTAATGMPRRAVYTAALKLKES
jgi:16S rRNA (cytidine1402-2'-O)-methyltransferase